MSPIAAQTKRGTWCLELDVQHLRHIADALGRDIEAWPAAESGDDLERIRALHALVTRCIDS